MSRLSPRHFVGVALAILLPFGALHLAGIRSWTSIVSLTFPENVSHEVALFFGGLYILLWAGVVLVVPIFLIAALIWGGLRTLQARS